MASPTSRPSLLVRALLVGLGVWLVALTLGTSYLIGRQATDENFFIEPPSRAYVTAEIPGTPGTGAPVVFPVPRFVPRDVDVTDRLVAGDLVIAVEGVFVDNVEAARERLRGAETREVLAFRAGTAALHSARVPAAPTADALRSIANTVVVMAVAPRGASDRAGMLVGDVITRIDNQGFSSRFEADGVMRQAAIGRETAYDILRGGEAMSLMVRLAAFGIQFSAAMALLVGLLYMCAGTLLVALRTHIKAARYLGLAWMTIGFMLAVLMRPRRGGLPYWLQVLTDMCMLGCALFGMAAWLHALHYFPRERVALLARRWVVPVTYSLAAVITGLGLVIHIRELPIGPLQGVMLGFLLFVVAASRGSKREYGAEELELARPLGRSLAVAITFVLLMAVGAIFSTPGPPPLTVTLGIPAVFLVVLGVHVYVIGRYRLLEADLRVRRNVQYLVLSTAWTVVVLAAGLWLWWVLIHLEVRLPNVRLTGDAIEILQSPMPEEQRAVLEKAFLVVVSVVLAFVFRAMLKRGHRFIAEQYYREGYDYRKASEHLSEVMGARMDLDGLADGILTVVDRLMPVKKAGVAFLEGQRIFAARRSTGFDPTDWDLFCRMCLDDALAALRQTSGEYDTEYAPPRLRLALRRADIQYLYPIRGHNQLRGVLFMGEKLSESAYTADDFVFLSVISAQASLLVENAFLYESLAQQERARQELALARRIQIDSLPREAPLVRGLDVAGRSTPALEVGGDYFDYLTGAPHELGVMVGDVSGKGTSAALYMSKLQGIVRSLHAFSLGPSELFIKTNELLGRDLERRAFVTVLGGFFDTARQTIVVARAGHLPLLHFEAGTGLVRRLLPRGLGLGLTHSALFEQELQEAHVPYAIGDAFLFVTDGITESHSAEGVDFSEERLTALFSELARTELPAAAIATRIAMAVAEFTEGMEQQDDQTVVVVRAVPADA